MCFASSCQGGWVGRPSLKPMDAFVLLVVLVVFVVCCLLYVCVCVCTLFVFC